MSPIDVLAVSAVALRKESVDRNYSRLFFGRDAPKSLSARRAWIEICPRSKKSDHLLRRSPQGERG